MPRIMSAILLASGVLVLSGCVTEQGAHDGHRGSPSDLPREHQEHPNSKAVDPDKSHHSDSPREHLDNRPSRQG